MGYYSNVTIACDKETCQKIIEVCNRFEIEIDEISDTGFFNYIYIYFIKWYGGEDYTREIDLILNGIDKRLKDEPNAFAVLLRDGEDTYDMAILRYGNEEMSGRFYAKTMLDCTP